MPFAQSITSAGRFIAEWFHFWWMKVPEPRVLSMLAGALYVVIITTGLVTLIYPPMSFQGQFSELATQMVGYFFVGGGLVGVVGGTADFWELERVGVVAMGLGLATYLYIVINLQIEAASGNRFSQMGVMIALGIALLGRLAMIWRYPYKPRR